MPFMEFAPLPEKIACNIVLTMSTIVLNMSTDIVDGTLSILFGKSRRNLLSLLFMRPGESFYLRQIQRLTGISAGAIQREINQLVKAGIIVRIVKDRRITYKANEKNPVFAEIKSIVIKTVGLGDALKKALAPLADQIRIALIYGSFAGGQPGEDSDVDIFIIGSVPFRQIVEALQETQEVIGREINPTVYPIEEFRNKVKESRHFIRSILEGPVIFLIGDHDGIRKLAE